MIQIICDWLNKFIAFNAFQLCYMTFAFNKMDWHGFSNIRDNREHKVPITQ